MSKPTPTLGYASRTEAALALKAKGLKNHQIAERMGVSQNAVSGLLRFAGDRRETPARQVPGETSAALRSGIMLSHEAARPVHRPTSDNSVRIVEVRLPGPQFGRLVEMARKAHRTPSAYAADLFQAAYSARCAPTGDRDLDGAVARLGTPEAASGPMVDALHAELERVRAELETLRRQLRAARMENDAHERCRQQLHDDLESLSARGLAMEAANWWRATGRNAAQKNGDDAGPVAPTPAAPDPTQASAAQMRQAKALRAAGNSIAEIAAALGMTAALVRQALEAR